MEDMHKKVIKTLIKIQNDDLKDAEMLADYAEKMRHHGNMAFAQKLSMRAKMRASHFAEDEKEIRETMDRIKGEAEDAPESIQAHMLDMMMETQRDRYHHLMARLDG